MKVGFIVSSILAYVELVPGVQFMYESVMGMRTRDQHGCILADEMFVILLLTNGF